MEKTLGGDRSMGKIRKSRIFNKQPMLSHQVSKNDFRWKWLIGSLFVISNWDDLSLGLVDKECYLLELEVKEPILLMHGMAPEVVTKDDVPVPSEVLI